MKIKDLIYYLSDHNLGMPVVLGIGFMLFIWIQYTNKPGVRPANGYWTPVPRRK